MGCRALPGSRLLGIETPCGHKLQQHWCKMITPLPQNKGQRQSQQFKFSIWRQAIGFGPVQIDGQHQMHRVCRIGAQDAFEARAGGLSTQNNDCINMLINNHFVVLHFHNKPSQTPVYAI